MKMEKVCVVPGCKTRVNKNDKRIKSSMFCIPKYGELNSQWIKVAPGVTTLKPTHVICEKHFSQQYVREFIQKNVDGNCGNLLAKSMCQRLHLITHPTKTIKEINSSNINSLSNFKEDFSSEFQPSVIEGIVLNQTEDNNKIFQTDSNQRNVNHLNNKLGESPEISILQNNISLTNEKDKTVRILKKVPKAKKVKKTNSSDINSTSSFKEDVTSDFQPSVSESVTDNHTGDKNTIFRTYNNKNKRNVINLNNTSEGSPKIKILQNVNINNYDKTARIPEDISKKLELLSKTYAVEHDYAVHDLSKPIEIRNATINIDCKSIELPKTWGVVEKTIQKKKYFMFMKVISQVVQYKVTEVLQKYVLLDCTEKNASYFVYGHKVEAATVLPEIIHNRDMLLESLNIFEGMQVCKGVGPIDLSVMQKSEMLIDSANILHHAKCTWLVTTSGVCEFCENLKGLISIRSNKRANNDTIGKELLKDLLSFKNLCLHHRVSNNHRLALREILNASRFARYGRKYSKEWLMFCISVCIRSRSTYEFLRKTNIIPLPSITSIRKQFNGKNPKGNFDKTFIDLIKKQGCNTLVHQNISSNDVQLDDR